MSKFYDNTNRDPTQNIAKTIGANLKSQDYIQFCVPFQKEIVKAVVDTIPLRPGERRKNKTKQNKKTKIEPATEIFCHIYDQILSPNSVSVFIPFIVLSSPCLRLKSVKKEKEGIVVLHEFQEKL